MSREPYPKARALLDRLVPDGVAMAPLAPFAIGPGVLRAPAEVSAPLVESDDVEPAGVGAAGEEPFEMGELVDMVLVGADESKSGDHEVHLVFKAEVLGGLHLRLQKRADGMHATFTVEDAAARRAVVHHVEELVAHLKGRGFNVASHAVEVRA